MAMSLFDKEATYDAGPAAWLAANACSMNDFDGLVAWEDQVVTNLEGVTGFELGTKQEILRQGMNLTYSETRLKPNTLAGLAALHFGTVASTQDGGLTAYRHKITPVAAGTDLPSIGVIAKEGGTQYVYKGVKSDQFTLSIGDGYFMLESVLMGSGTRATDATSFPAKITEDWLKTARVQGLWLETGANISIADPPVQGSEGISSATPDDLTDRLIDFSFVHNNNLRGDIGYTAGGGDVRTRLDAGRRAAEVTIVLERDSSTFAAELAYYTGQVDCAIEMHI
jgi:hypothetical protein